MNKNMVSIIIPYYNQYQYLQKCLDHAIKQDYENLEVIVVNDGSQDAGVKICDEYDKKYKNFYVIHQDHAGVSAARNLGLCKAKGDWILFCDSDDYIELFTVSSLIRTIGNNYCDFIFFDAINLYDNQECPDKRSIRFDGPKKGTEVLKILHQGQSSKYKKELPPREFRCSVNWHMYRRKFLLEKKLTFREHMIREDELFSFYAYALAENVLRDNGVYYHYRHHHGSTMSSPTIHHIRGLEIVCREIIGYYNNNLPSDADAILGHLVIMCNMLLKCIKKLCFEDKGKNKYAEFEEAKGIFINLLKLTQKYRDSTPLGCRFKNLQCRWEYFLVNLEKVTC